MAKNYLLIFALICLSLAVYSNSQGTVTLFNIPDNMAPNVTNLTITPPIPPSTNESSNHSVNFTVDEFPVNVTFEIVNLTNITVDVQGPYQINQSSDLPINFTIPPGLPVGNYTINMSVVDNSSNKNESVIGFFQINATVPLLINSTLSPIIVPINGTVNLSANVSGLNVDKCFANITFPNGSSVIVVDPCDNATFVAPNVTGVYTVTFGANTTNGLITLDPIPKNFTVGVPLLWIANVVNNQLIGLSSRLQIFFSNTGILVDSQTDGFYLENVTQNLYDLRFSALNDSWIVELQRVDLATNNNQTIGLDIVTNFSGFLGVYGILNANYSFEEAIVNISYANLSFADEGNLAVQVCENYTFVNRTCQGGFVTQPATKNQVTNRFIFTRSNFSAFGIKEITPAPTPSTGSSGGGGGGGSSRDEPEPCFEYWDCSAWGPCKNSKEIRACLDVNGCGLTLWKPAETRACGTVSDCDPRWECGEWGYCSVTTATQQRSCRDVNNCDIAARPLEDRECEPVLLAQEAPTFFSELLYTRRLGLLAAALVFLALSGILLVQRSHREVLKKWYLPVTELSLLLFTLLLVGLSIGPWEWWNTWVGWFSVASWVMIITLTLISLGVLIATTLWLFAVLQIVHDQRPLLSHTDKKWTSWKPTWKFPLLTKNWIPWKTLFARRKTWIPIDQLKQRHRSLWESIKSLFKSRK
jgi:hypothetical protein